MSVGDDSILVRCFQTSVFRRIYFRSREGRVTSLCAVIRFELREVVGVASTSRVVLAGAGPQWSTL